ncbi:MAG: hypothetical protein AB1351_04615 [Thermoproteota archaeon]
MKKPQECPRCRRSSGEALCVEERAFENGAAVLICQCGYFKEIPR